MQKNKEAVIHFTKIARDRFQIYDFRNKSNTMANTRDLANYLINLRGGQTLDNSFYSKLISMPNFSTIAISKDALNITKKASSTKLEPWKLEKTADGEVFVSAIEDEEDKEDLKKCASSNLKHKYVVSITAKNEDQKIKTYASVKKSACIPEMCIEINPVSDCVNFDYESEKAPYDVIEEIIGLLANVGLVIDPKQVECCHDFCDCGMDQVGPVVPCENNEFILDCYDQKPIVGQSIESLKSYAEAHNRKHFKIYAYDKVAFDSDAVIKVKAEDNNKSLFTLYLYSDTDNFVESRDFHTFKEAADSFLQIQKEMGERKTDPVLINYMKIKETTDNGEKVLKSWEGADPGNLIPSEAESEAVVETETKEETETSTPAPLPTSEAKKEVEEKVETSEGQKLEDKVEETVKASAKKEDLAKKALLITTEDFSDYKPWSGAVDTYNMIRDAGKLDALESYLEELYPEGIDMTQINDILWFEGDQVLEALGIAEEEEDIEDTAKDNSADIKKKADSKDGYSLEEGNDYYQIFKNNETGKFKIWNIDNNAWEASNEFDDIASAEKEIENLAEGLPEKTAKEKINFEKDLMEAGESKGKKDKVNKKQLEMGKKVEKEHTTSPEIAEKITRDHLKEMPDYYTHLKEMEKGVEKKAETNADPKVVIDKLEKGDLLPGTAERKEGLEKVVNDKEYKEDIKELKDKGAITEKEIKEVKKEDIDKKSKVVKQDGKYQAQSEKGKNFGTYDTKQEAKDRVKQMEMFKHMKKKSADKDFAQEFTNMMEEVDEKAQDKKLAHDDISDSIKELEKALSNKEDALNEVKDAADVYMLYGKKGQSYDQFLKEYNVEAEKDTVQIVENYITKNNVLPKNAELDKKAEDDFEGDLDDAIVAGAIQYYRDEGFVEYDTVEYDILKSFGYTLIQSPTNKNHYYVKELEEDNPLNNKNADEYTEVVKEVTGATDVKPTLDTYGLKTYEAENEEWAVTDNYKEVEAAVKEDIKDLLDDLGVDALMWDNMGGIENYLDSKWFEEARQESNESYAEDILSSEPERFIEEAKELKLDTDYAGYELNDPEGDHSAAISDFAEAMKEQQEENPIEWYINNFGKDSIKDLIKAGHISFDIDAIVKEVMELDGPGHVISVYDGKMIEKDHNGKTYYLFRMASKNSKLNKKAEEQKEYHAEIYTKLDPDNNAEGFDAERHEHEYFKTLEEAKAWGAEHTKDGKHYYEVSLDDKVVDSSEKEDITKEADKVLVDKNTNQPLKPGETTEGKELKEVEVDKSESTVTASNAVYNLFMKSAKINVNAQELRLLTAAYNSNLFKKVAYFGPTAFSFADKHATFIVENGIATCHKTADLTEVEIDKAIKEDPKPATKNEAEDFIKELNKELEVK